MPAPAQWAFEPHTQHTHLQEPAASLAAGGERRRRGSLCQALGTAQAEICGSVPWRQHLQHGLDDVLLICLAQGQRQVGIGQDEVGRQLDR